MSKRCTGCMGLLAAILWLGFLPSAFASISGVPTRSRLALQQPSLGNWTHAYTYDTARRLKTVSGSSGTFNYAYTPAVAGVYASRLVQGMSPPARKPVRIASLKTGEMMASISAHRIARASGPRRHGDAAGRTDCDRRKQGRRKNRLRLKRKKTPPKNTPPIPVFKLPTLSGFQLGADKGISIPTSPGSVITNQYDATGRLRGTTLRGASTTFNSHVFTGVNQAHQLTRQRRPDSTLVDYTYDTASQLKTALSYDSTGSVPINSEQFKYGYDTAQNMVKFTNHTAVTTYTVNSLNQVTADGTFTYTYDWNGNRVTQSGTTAFAYDDENQLTTITYQPGAGTGYRTQAVPRLAKHLNGEPAGGGEIEGP